MRIAQQLSCALLIACTTATYAHDTMTCFYPKNGSSLQTSTAECLVSAGNKGTYTHQSNHTNAKLELTSGKSITCQNIYKYGMLTGEGIWQATNTGSCPKKMTPPTSSQKAAQK